MVLNLLSPATIAVLQIFDASYIFETELFPSHTTEVKTNGKPKLLAIEDNARIVCLN